MRHSDSENQIKHSADIGVSNSIVFITFAPMGKISINLKTGSVEKKKNVVVGIDLGTTNSLVAVIDESTGKAKALAGVKDTKVITPSIIHFTENGDFVIGDAAKQALVDNPEMTVYSVKRLLGKSYGDLSEVANHFGYKIIDEDTESLVKIKLGERFFTPIELSAEILKSLKAKAESSMGQEVTKAVITVPAYFNDSQRQATRDAGKLAGLEVLRIVNEPTAASLSYGIGLNKDEEKTVAVYDLGGGTFDISILRIEGGVFEVLATNGDTFLGGDDFDRAIMDHWVKTKENLADIQPSDQQALRLMAEEAKKTVGKGESFKEDFNSLSLELTQAQFGGLIAPLVNRTLDCCKNAVADSGVSLDEIQEVVMVGGSTRVPQVIGAVKGYFKNSTIDNSLNPDEIVALGAAIEADILAGNRRDVLLLDVTPLSLGIETLGGLMDVIIPRNSRVPFKAGRNYTTSVDGQVNLKISVFQGERDQVSENRKLAEFVLNGIPAMPAGLPKIEIAFMLDADGILKVRAKELRSGVEQTIDVKPQYGLTDEEVESMLMDSLKNAEDDMAYRQLNEAMNESNYMLVNTEKFLTNEDNDISEEQENEVRRLMEALRMSFETKDKDAIQRAQDDLNEYTKPFAESLMDKSIGKALRGKDIG